MNTHVDIVDQGRGFGPVANELLSMGRKTDVGLMRPWIGKDGKVYITTFKGGDPANTENYKSYLASSMGIQTNGTLRRDEWKQLDDAVMKIAEYRLGGYDDLVSRGLVYNLGNGMGSTVLEWHDVGDALTAEVTMDGVTRAQNDRPKFQHNYLPLPIVHVDYEINTRALETSRNMGNGIDTTLAERAARRVAETLENMLFTDWDYGYGDLDSRSRNKIYSYVNFPDRIQVTLSTYGSWSDNSATTGAAILQSVLAMKQASINNYFYGPWQLYIPTAYETRLDNDYDTTTPGTTIRERIMKVAGITGIKVIDTLATDNVLMVQMTSDVVRLVRGLGIQNVEWQTEGRFITKYKVLTLQVPQIRSDQNGRTGIVHMA
jgi:uncharacterized linocin/CFP29 family protein